MTKLLRFIFFLPTFVFSQITFQRIYGDSGPDLGYSVQQTRGGGYIIAGETWPLGEELQDVYLIKTDSLGNPQWQRTYGGSSYDLGRSVQQTFDGGYIITGGTESFGAGGTDVYLIKTDANGDTVWTRTYGGSYGDWGLSVVQTPDSGYILTGVTMSFGAGDWDVYLIKTDKNGEMVWAKTFGWENMDCGNSIALTPDGGYIIGGVTYSTPNGEGDIYIIKTKANGDTIWTKTYGGDAYEWGAPIAVTNDGGYIVTGERLISRNCGSLRIKPKTFSFTGQLIACSQQENRDVWILKLNATGDTIWTKTYGGLDCDCGLSIQPTQDNGYIIAGHTTLLGTGEDVWLIKTDSQGDTVWTKIYGGAYRDEGWAVRQTLDGGYIIAGGTDSFGTGLDDVYLIKTDANGNVGIAEKKPKIKPRCFSIEPNPFSNFTEISYSIQKTSYVSCGIYDVSGKLVRELKSGSAVPGVYNLKWDGRDEKNARLSPGIYFINLKTNESKITRKIVLLR
ncbi:MAG: T9SS type A sorting domain-containing protein [bacterium]